VPSSTSHNPKILLEAGQPLCATPPARRPVCSELLLQSPCPRVASADLGWGSHPGVQSRSGAAICFGGPLALLGTGAGPSPLNKLNRPGSTGEMLPLLVGVQTCPVSGRGEQERILQDEAPASSPNLHTGLLQPYKVCVTITQRRPGYRKTSSSISTPQPWPSEGSFCFSNHCGNHQSNGDFLPLPYFCSEVPSWGVSLCPLGTGTSLLPAQSLLPWCCRITKAEVNMARNWTLAFI